MKFIPCLLAMAILMTGCREQELSQPKPQQLQLAFDWLDADGRDAAYVVLEDPEKENYLQFGLMRDQWIHFDIPTYAQGSSTFKPDHAWKIVDTLPTLLPSTRRNYISPKASDDLWAFLKSEGLEPYYLRSIYEQDGKTIATNESLCFNVPRKDRSRCISLAKRVFELAHGYPLPEVLNLTANQTHWVFPNQK